MPGHFSVLALEAPPVMTRAAVPVIAVVLLLLSGARVARSGAQAGTGAIEGRITFAGAPPPPTIVIQDGGSQQVLYVDRSGGLRYAVVFLPDAAADGGGPSSAPAVMNQRNFIFEPQVLAVRAGQVVRFTSDDLANHNVRVQDSTPANTFSINTGSGSMGPHTHRFGPTPAGRALALSCDIHPWMAAWAYVFEHAQFAVTNPDGTFRIAGVPPGRHRLAVRQPSGGLKRDLAVDVRAAETAHVDVRFTSADVSAPPR
jgi:plastocyanin